jgi:small nuclear ribonucleoprotein E
MYNVIVFQGFDEYMNLVLDESEEVHMKTKNRKTLGVL